MEIPKEKSIAHENRIRNIEMIVLDYLEVYNWKIDLAVSSLGEGAFTYKIKKIRKKKNKGIKKFIPYIIKSKESGGKRNEKGFLHL